MPEKYHEIEINSRNYGELKGIKIYVTDILYKQMEKASLINGKTRLQLLKEGRALQGMKHLLMLIHQNNSKAKIIFHTGTTNKENGRYFINFDDYRNKAKSRFIELYRQTGLDIARKYLSSYFPDEFIYEPAALSNYEIEKLNKNLPRVLGTLSGRSLKSQQMILEEAANIIKKLKRKNKALKESINVIQSESSLIYYESRLEELKGRLEKNYPETSSPNSWQSWIHKNNWLFGVRYLPPIQKEKVGFDHIPDFLFPTSDGYIDVLEIKNHKKVCY
jgi:hypothetical protein